MNRPAIPKKIRESVLSEYSHLCAICGAVKPQLHHIDEDRENNTADNLIPLCANHHLSDQHNPTRRIEIGILRLFRKYKDPTFLSPQFVPLWARMNYLYCCSDLDQSDIVKAHLDLVKFVMNLEMGTYYGDRIKKIIRTKIPRVGRLDDSAIQKQIADLRQQICERRDEAIDLIAELLRYQNNWVFRID